MLLDGYVDGELDLVRHLEIERHLQTCTGCAQRYANYQTLRNAVRGSSLYVSAPPALHKRIQGLVAQSSEPAPKPRRLSPRLLRPWLTGAIALAAAVLLVWGTVHGWSWPFVDDRVTQDVIEGHVRSLMVTHIADVASSDQHTVKPWFDGKLDFSPPVEDLADQGYPLVGGRLDYLDSRSVAALVYQRRKHVINLFIWPSGDGDRATTSVTRQGYYLVHWTRSGMTYWAVSDLNIDELQAFSHLIQQRVAPSSTP
ncbi:MAG: anti-sigma factor [Herpetosiphonaceae bacterium]|nr:anti-sigma factor [Herpetosiphonaceae bacterium]